MSGQPWGATPPQRDAMYPHPALLGGYREAPQVFARHAFADLPDDANDVEIREVLQRELARPGANRPALRAEIERRFPRSAMSSAPEFDQLATAVAGAAARGERAARVYTETEAQRDAREASEGHDALAAVDRRRADAFIADGDRVLAGRGVERTGRTEVHTAGSLDERAPGGGIGVRHTRRTEPGPHAEAGEPTRTTTHSATATFSPATGPELAAGTTRTVDHGGGVSETRAATAGFSVASGEATVGVTRSVGREGDQRTVGAEVGVDTSLSGIEGMSASVSAGRGRRTVTLRGGFEIEIEEPVRQPNGTYRINGTLDLSAGVGASDRSVSSSGGGRGSGSASIGYRGRRGFTRVFENEARAQEFYNDTQRYFDLHGLSAFDLDGVSSAAEADAMAVGESVTRRDGVEASGGLTWTQRALQIGATVSIGRNHEARVTRSSESAVRLRITDTTRAGISATAGVPTTGIRLGADGTSSTGAEVEFDLTTPEGRTALDRALAGEVPLGAAGPGWRLVSTQAGSTRGESHGVDVVVGGYTSSATTGVSDQRAADGTSTRVYTGRAELSAQTILPDEMTEGTALGAAREQVEIEMSSRGQTELSAEIQGSDARDAQRSLSEITGAPGQPHLATGAAAGTWQVSAQLTDAQLRRFMDQAADGTINLLDVGIANETHLRALVAALRRARDLPEARRMDHARRAVAEFFAETGPDGSRALRAALGEAPRFDVALEGSDVFTGDAGNTHLRGQIEALRARRTAEGTDRLALANEARTLLREQERRLARMRDRGQFRELPLQLRQQQIAALEPIVRDLRTLTQQLDAEAQAPSPAEQRAAAETEAAGEATQSSRLEHGVGPESRPEDGPAQREREQFDRAAERMRQAQLECQRVYNVVRRERDLHYGRGVSVFRAPAIEGLYTERDAYERADQHWTQAQRFISQGQDWQARFDQAAATRSAPRLDASAIQQATSESELFATEAAAAYTKAAGRMRNCYRDLLQIRVRHWAERQFWGERPPPIRDP